MISQFPVFSKKPFNIPQTSVFKNKNFSGKYTKLVLPLIISNSINQCKFESSAFEILFPWISRSNLGNTKQSTKASRK